MWKSSWFLLQRSCGQGYVYTRVCHSVNRGVCYPSMPCSRSLRGLVCLLLGCGGVSGLPLGGSTPRGCLLPRGVSAPRGVFAPGGCLFLGGLLLGVAFCCGLLVWPSGMAFWLQVAFWLKVVFWYGLLVRPNRDPFQPEGHNSSKAPDQKAIPEWPSGMAWELVRPCVMAFWLKVVFCYGLLVEGVSIRRDPPCRRLLLQTVRILLECILVTTATARCGCVSWVRMSSIQMSANGVFHKLDEIGNNANIGIRGFTMWKQKKLVKKCYPSEYWTPGPLIPSPTL